MRHFVNHRKKLRVVVSLCTAGALAAAGTAVAIDATSSDPSQYHAPVTADAASASTSSSAFQRASTSTDVMPADFKSRLANTDPQFGPNVSDARHVTASNGDDAYLVPATGGLCAASANEAFCASDATIASGGAVTVDLCSPTLPKGQVELAWLLPDGTSNVVIDKADGTHVAVSSKSSIYIERFSTTGSVPKTIEWDTSSGHHTASSQVPDDDQTSDCVHPGDVPPPSALPKPPPNLTLSTR
jgi:hypothetical protein